MATEILFNAIHEFAYPLLEAAGLMVDPYGYVTDRQGKKLCMKNPRYQEGDDTNEVSPVNYLCIPIKDSDYLEIKEKNDTELFNPFNNIKHMIVIAVKLKKLAVVDLSPELTSKAVDEDDWDQFDEYIGLSNDVNMMGEIDYALVDLYDPAKREIIRHPCPPNEPIKGLWQLCVDIYNRYVSMRPPYLKQFQDTEKSWKKIHAAMVKWDKARKTIIKDIRKEENESIDLNYMDLSNGIDPNQAINVYTMNKPLTGEDFLFTDDGTDMYQKPLQDYLTSLFLPESLKPYEEPVESDEEVGTVVTPITEEEAAIEDMKLAEKKMLGIEATNLNIIPIKSVEREAPAPKPAIVKEIKTELEVRQIQEPGKEKKQNAMFKLSASATPIQNTNNMMQQQGFGFGFNPMMNMGINRQNNMDIDSMCLGSVIDPFSFYR